jgi:hypothetical protein
VLPLGVPALGFGALHRLPPGGGGAGLPFPLRKDRTDGEEVAGDDKRGAERDVGLLEVGLGGQEGAPADLLPLHVECADLGDGEAVDGLEAAADVHLGSGGDGPDGELLDGGERGRREHELEREVGEVDHAAAQAGPHGCRAAAEAARGGRDVAAEGLGERRRIDGRMGSASFASGLRPTNQRVTRTVRITGPQAQLATGRYRFHLDCILLTKSTNSPPNLDMTKAKPFNIN